MTATAIETPMQLSLNYCDACTSALAVYRVWVDRWNVEAQKSYDLTLCSHHFNSHESKILELGYEVDDI